MRFRDESRVVVSAASATRLPDALARKYPRAAREFGWQFIFASVQRAVDPQQIYTHVLNRGAGGVRSPLDRAG